MSSATTHPDATVGSMIRRCARRRPSDPAITFAGTTYSFSDLDERSNRAAAAMRTAGVGPQDRVAYLDKNGIEFFDVMFGASKINAAIVPLNWRNSPAEILGILGDARPRMVFVGDEFADTIDLDSLKTCTAIVIGGDDSPFDAWTAKCAADPVVVESGPDDAYLQLYTSGTTGTPKGVVIANRTSQLFDELAAQLSFSPRTVLLMVLPLFHTSSSIALSALSAGGHCVLHREVDLRASLAAIPEHQVTHAGFVPALLAALNSLSAEMPGDFSSLELIMYGASPISETVLQDAIRVFGCDFAQLYGLTESGGTVAMLMPEQHDPKGCPELLRSLGKPLPWVEMQVVSPESHDVLPAGQPGELWVRSSQVMREYFDREDETGAAFVDGWLRTGDIAERDEDGYYYLKDRLKDVIVSGAENVYPAEVENLLMAHPGILEVAVIGVPDPKWGETVKAIVLPATGATLEAGELISFARDRIARYKCPTSVDFVDEPLPRNASGKLLKRVIREPYWAGHGRSIG
jgi:long-chain acyl-CoA synthetase